MYRFSTFLYILCGFGGDLLNLLNQHIHSFAVFGVIGKQCIEVFHKIRYFVTG